MPVVHCEAQADGAGESDGRCGGGERGSARSDDGKQVYEVLDRVRMAGGRRGCESEEQEGQ